MTLVNQGADTEIKKELSSIYISQAPSKVTYTAGESFDPAGIAVMAKWSDGSETDVTQEVTYSAGTLQTGMSSIIVTYTSDGVAKTAEQAITVTDPVTVDSVAVNPEQTELSPGESLTFGVAVTGTGNPSTQVEWSLSGAVSADTKIDENGKLQVGADETAQSLTVTAVSVADRTKSAQAVITIVPAEVSDTSQPSEEPDDIQTPDTEAPEEEAPDGAASVEANIRDEATGIWVKGSLAQGTTIAVETINSESEQYAAYVEPVKKRTILGVYDIKLSQELADGESVELGFPVDASYNDQEVTILHYVEKDGRMFTEQHGGTVKNGEVSIQVNGFSPYVVVLNDAPAEEPPENSETPDNEQPSGNETTPGVNYPTANAPTPDSSLSSGDAETPDASANPENNTSGNNTGTGTGNVTTDTTGSNSPSNQINTGSGVTGGQAEQVSQEANGGKITDTSKTAENTQAAENGQKAAGEQNKENVAAKTGDNTPIAIWIVMILLASAGIVYWLYEKKKSVK